MKNSFFKCGVIGLLLALLPISNSVYADGRQRSEMDSIAMSLLCGGNDMKRVPSMQIGKTASALKIKAKGSDFLPLGEVKNDAFYVYALDNGVPGYAIISTDDAMPAVLGYSDNGVFDIDNMPDAMRELLSYYATAPVALYAEEGGEEVANEVQPLLGNIAFDQGAPYNGQCPMYEGERTLVGCLATAVAEIVAYYRYPARMNGGTINYTSGSYKIPVTWNCDTTVFDWENIRDSYSSLMEDFTGELKISAADYMIHTGITPSTTYYGYFEISNFLNVVSSTLNFTAQMILADSKGNYIRPVGNPLEVTNLAPTHYYPVYYLTHGIPADLPDGKYRMYVGIKMNGSDEWNIVKRANANDMYNSQRVESYVTAQKKGNTYIIAGQTYPCGYTPVEGDAVAELSAVCGAISLMDYGVDASGAIYPDAAAGLIRYMGYDKDIKYLYPKNFSTKGWIERIKSELHDGNPILCAGVTEKPAGHAFVLDGYRYTNDTPYFHINWGWSGSANGYFLITNLTPGSAGAGGTVDNYAYDLTLITKIKPDDGVDEGHFVSASSLKINEDGVRVGGKFQVTAKTLMNCSPSTITGTVNVYAVSGDTKYLLGKYVSYAGWAPLSYYNELAYQVTVPATMPTGNYKICLYTTNSNGVDALVQVPSTPSLYINNPDMPTSIDGVEAQQGDAAIYDISGRVTDDEQGVYIKQGKKYFTK